MSNEVKQARSEMGLTQAKMAALMGISARKYCRWEYGTSPVSAEGRKLLEMLLEQHRQATGEK